MKSLLTTVTLLLLFTGPASAQRIELQTFPAAADESEPHTHGHWCMTTHLFATPEGRAAMDRYHAARANGTLPVAAKSQGTLEIGAIQSFNIISDSNWTTAEFELRMTGSRWRAWLRSDVPDQDIVVNARFEQMRTELDETTPAGSFNPNQGVFQNDIDIFGEPPIYPAGSDGIIDILIYELDEGVAGFVHPSDYDPGAPPEAGNQGETMYMNIGTFKTPGSGVFESVLAHELQHVIHVNYDTREMSFVNEGQSEAAQQLNGYPVALPSHLIFTSPPEYNVSFFTWRGLNSNDYARAALWTGFLAEQVGPDVLGEVTRSDDVGGAGYTDAFERAGIQRTFSDLLADYHTANLINDRAVDPRWGYVSQQRTGELGAMRIPRSSRFDGFDGAGITADSLVVNQGAAEYVVLNNVKDVVFDIDVVASADQLANRRTQMLVRAVGFDPDGGVSSIEFKPSIESHTLQGTFDQVRIAFIHLRPESTPLRTLVEIDWTQDPDRQVTTIGYSTDEGAARGGEAALFFVEPEGNSQATVFEPPVGSVLDRVDGVNLIHGNIN